MRFQAVEGSDTLPGGRTRRPYFGAYAPWPPLPRAGEGEAQPIHRAASPLPRAGEGPGVRDKSRSVPVFLGALTNHPEALDRR